MVTKESALTVSTNYGRIPHEPNLVSQGFQKNLKIVGAFLMELVPPAARNPGSPLH